MEFPLCNEGKHKKILYTFHNNGKGGVKRAKLAWNRLK